MTPCGKLQRRPLPMQPTWVCSMPISTRPTNTCQRAKRDVNWSSSSASSTKPGGNMPVDIVVGAAVDGDVETIRFDNTPADTSSLGISSADVGTVGTARAAMGSLTSALASVSKHRATYGALTNRLEVAASSLGEAALNIESARSRIVDADIAETVSVRTRMQVLQDAGVAMLAQSAKNPQLALSLFR